MNVKLAGKSYQGTRQQILQALKVTGGSTVQNLAELVDVSPVTVRHHIGSLQADGLVTISLERRSVGRPHHIYSLTQAGENLFPQQYLNLLKRLLTQIKKTSGGQFEEYLNGIAKDLFKEYSNRLEGKSVREKMASLVDILDAEGLMVQWEEEEGVITIQAHNCPYRALLEKHPEICLFDQALINVLLDAPVERVELFQDGYPHCIFKTSWAVVENG